MKRCLALICALLPAAVAATELRSYDKLGPIDLGFWDRPNAFLQIQAFVGEHWKAHRRGYIVFTSSTIEGEPTTTQLFIEPKQSGQWHIRGISDSIYSDKRAVDDPQKQPNRHLTQKFDAVSVTCTEGKPSLVLKDAAGKIVFCFNPEV